MELRKLIKYSFASVVTVAVLIAVYFGLFIWHREHITSFCKQFTDKPLAEFTAKIDTLYFVEIDEVEGHFIKLKNEDFWVRPHVYIFSAFAPLRLGCSVSHDGSQIITHGTHQSAPWPFHNPVEEHFAKDPNLK